MRHAKCFPNHPVLLNWQIQPRDYNAQTSQTLRAGVTAEGNAKMVQRCAARNTRGAVLLFIVSLVTATVVAGFFSQATWRDGLF